MKPSFKTTAFLILLIFSSNNIISQVKSCDYLGQKTPGLKPELFAAEIFHKAKPEWTYCTEFTDSLKEFYFTSFDTSTKIENIMFVQCIDGVWSEPQCASFSGNYNDNDPRLAPDGKTIFWRSKRPLPGNNKSEKYSMIWYSSRIENKWSEPSPVKSGDTYLEAGYPSITSSGKLYYSAYKENNVGASDIYCAEFKNGEINNPKNLGSQLNTIYPEGDLYISPDENFLIVSCWNRPDNNGESDLYISFKNENGNWTKLRNLGEPINTKHNENCPGFSPDGKYFFYNSVEADKEVPETKTYWIDSKIFNTFKP